MVREKEIIIEEKSENSVMTGEAPKELKYSFQILGYIFLLGAIGAAVAWIYYVAVWAMEVYNKIDGTDTNPEFNNGDIKGKEAYSNYLIEISFQAVIASCLLYIAFRHHFHR